MDGGRFLVAYVPITDSDGRCRWLTNDNDGRYLAVDPIDLPNAVLQRVYRLYKTTYKNLSAQPLISNAAGLLDYTRWILFYDGDARSEDVPEASQIVGFALFKVKVAGLKAGLKGHDGSKDGKRGVIQFAIRSYNTQGVFGEISPPLDDRIAKDVPAVTFGDAEKVLLQLGKTDVSPTAGEHYERTIGNLGKVEKLMVGWPLLAPSAGVPVSRQTKKSKKKRRSKR